MDLCALPDIDIDHLLDATTALEDGFLEPFRPISMPKANACTRKKRSRLAERMAQVDELIRQVKQLQGQNKQLEDLQRTAQEVTDLYQKEKQQRLELQTQSRQLGEKCAELEKELDAQVIQCENLQEELETRALPVSAKEVLGVLLQLDHRLGDDAGLARRDQNIVKKLKDYCKTANISVPTPKSPPQRNKRRSQATQTDAEPLPEKPPQCTVAVQVENLVQTRDQGTQHKKTTTTRGTTTASFIKKHDVGTSFPEPKPPPNVRQILDEMLSWRDKPLRPLSPLCDLLPEVEAVSASVSVATCTTLCNIHREIDFMSEVPPQIKVSASRPPSRTMLDSVKEEARSTREIAKEMLNFIPQNQSCLASLQPQAFEELWQVFGQMVLGLLQRRSSPPSVSQADFSRWLFELYEGTQGPSQQSASSCAGKKDFSGSTDGIDVAIDPIIASPNISHGGDVTAIRLPPKPRNQKKHKSKKRKSAASLIKPIAKRTCQETAPVADGPESRREAEELEHNREPETAIQFLSSLNTFNTANCDNLDVELNEEEKWLLQLTSKPTMQEKQEQNKEGECVNQFPPLPKVHVETESSLKDDKALEHTENRTETTQIPDRITRKEAEPENLLPSLPELLLEESDPSESFLSCAGMDLDQPREQASISKLRDEPPTPPDTPPNDSDSDKESNLCEDQLEEIDSDSNSFEELFTPTSPKEADNCLYSSVSDSDSEDNTVQSVILNSNPCKSPKSKGNALSYLFGSDSDLESEASEQEDSKESEKEASKKSDRETKTKLEPIDSEEDWLEIDACSDDIEETVANEHKTLNESNNKPDNSEKKLSKDQADLVPSFPNLKKDSNLEKILLLHSQLSSPALSSSDDSDDHKLIIDIETSSSSADSPPLATCKRRRTLSEFKSPPTPGEGCLTRQKAKKLLLERNCSTESTTSLAEQIRRQLKQALNKSEPLKRNCYFAPVKTVEQQLKSPQDVQPEQSYRCNEESPASPPSEPTEELVDSITEIPLEQHDGLQDDGQPKSIIQHVIDQCKAEPKLSQQRRKTLGKSQQKLCTAIGKYLKEDLELEAFSLEVYKLTKIEAVIVNALVVVVTQIGLEEKPLECLLSALKYFDFTQRFLAELEERLFRNTKERPPTELAMKYVKLYLAAVSQETSGTPGYANPARLLLAKLLYHYELDMPVTVLEVLRQFPTVLPHREERQYDQSDPLITVIKHLLMSRTYDMQDPEGAERLLLSKLRFEYHYQPFEPNKEQVLENLVEKLKAGRSLEQLGYAFALFCRRSPHMKDVDLVVTEHLMPLATSYCDLAAAAQNESYDDRLVAVLQCISMVLKPLPLDTDISAFVGLVKRFFVAVPRPGVQQAAVQACLRLQRFGFQTIRDALQNYRPDYPLEPLTRAMLRCFAERRKQYRILAPKRVPKK